MFLRIATVCSKLYFIVVAVLQSVLVSRYAEDGRSV